MSDIQSLLNLPLSTLAVLAAGYAAYKIAFTGKTKKHSSIDIILIVIVFGFVAKLLIIASEYCFTNSIYQTGLAFLCTMMLSAFWRKWGENWLHKLLSLGKISYSDGTDSAWDTMRLAVKYKPTQLIVRKINGKQVMSSNLNNFDKLPHGPCIYGEDGSISLYVTHFKLNTAGEWEKNDPISKGWGGAITYIPANQISEIEVRHQI